MPLPNKRVPLGNWHLKEEREKREEHHPSDSFKSCHSEFHVFVSLKKKDYFTLKLSSLKREVKYVALR